MWQVVTTAIVCKVPFTNVDWESYMIQASRSFFPECGVFGIAALVQNRHFWALVRAWAFERSKNGSFLKAALVQNRRFWAFGTGPGVGEAGLVQNRHF